MPSKPGRGAGGGFLAVLRLIAKVILWLVGWIVLLLAGLWAFGAMWFDFPVHGLREAAAWIFAAGAIAALVFVQPRWRAKLGVAAAIVLIAAWWFTLKPSNDRKWQPDVAQTAWAEINGDVVTFHNVRNFDYRTDTDYTPHWETRTVQLSKLTGLDLAIDYWGSPWMAHPIACFDFSDGLPICFSIETRKEVGEDYSAIGGLYRDYELIYIVADERDSLRVRTNYRKGEDVFLYHSTNSPAQVRAMFLEYVTVLNSLTTRPRWYNAITANCTTSIRSQREAGERTPWDWRILLNGKGDEMLYERHLIDTAGLPFDELKRRSWINDRARAADKDPDFSVRIRQGLP